MAAALLAACGPPAKPAAAAAPSAVEIPAAETSAAQDETPPPEAVRRPTPTPEADPFEYFVGVWDGEVNNTLNTQLLVQPDGQFTVRSKAHPRQKACELNGRFRAEASKIFLEVAESTCSVQSIGKTLERDVVDKQDSGFVAMSVSGDLRIVYRRVPTP